MIDREAIARLLERVETATGPDRELARLVQRQVGGWHRVAPRQARTKNGGWISPDDWIGELSDGSPILDSLHGTDIHRDVPDVTASLDAALALLGRVLPSWCWQIKHGIECEAIVWSMTVDYDDDGAPSGRDPYSPALALIRATLRALLAAQEASRG